MELLEEVQLLSLAKLQSPRSRKDTKEHSSVSGVTCDDWSNMLSVGEQQRIGFARIFTNKPRFVFLDESTSALDVGSEHRLYTKLRNSSFRYISIGHRPTLLEFHDRVLHIEGNGRWKIMSPQEYRTRKLEMYSQQRTPTTLQT